MTFEAPYFILILLSLVLLLPFATLAFADSGVSDSIDLGFDKLDEYFKGLIENAKLTGDETPLGTTEDELNEVLDSSIQTGKDGKNLLFSFHELVENIINAVVPEEYEIDPLIVLLISWGVGFLMVYGITKGSVKHLILFGGIFGLVIVLFMIGGINPQF